jgi:transforming growth factor-beta-induced protein
MTLSFKRLAAASFLLVASTGASLAQDIVDTAVKAGSFNTLVAAVKAAGLVDTLKGKGPFTVFAPTDDAFKKLPAGTLESLLKPENKKTLTSILTYHVVSGDYPAARIVKPKASTYNLKSVEGSSIIVNKASGVKVSGATVSKTDIKTSNGTIHVIDSVILPPKVKAALAGGAKTHAAAAKKH